jgi:glutathionyl-hydroquinone reductase
LSRDFIFLAVVVLLCGDGSATTEYRVGLKKQQQVYEKNVEHFKQKRKKELDKSLSDYRYEILCPSKQRDRNWHLVGN